MGTYTKLPNVIIDAMPSMNEAELRVTLALARITVGFHRNEARARFSDLEAMTGMSRQGVANGVSGVLKRGIFCKGNGRSVWVYCETQQKEDDADLANSQLSRPNENGKQSTKLTKTVNLVDQNSQLSRPNTSGLKKEERKYKEIIERLLKRFTEMTALIEPHPSTYQYADKWEKPMEQIAKKADGDEETAIVLIEQAINLMRDKQYTVVAPSSILTAVSNLQNPMKKAAMATADGGYNV